MPVKFRVSVSLLFGALVLFAQQSVGADEAPRSIMFETDNNAGDPRTTLPAAGSQDSGQHCAELSRRMDELKGKPQQRFALSQQFAAECQR